MVYWDGLGNGWKYKNLQAATGRVQMDSLVMLIHQFAGYRGGCLQYFLNGYLVDWDSLIINSREYAKIFSQIKR
jgi:hypothetical protein